MCPLLGGSTVLSQTLQKVGEEGQKFLVELLVAASSNGPEESSQEEKVVAGFRGRVGQGHGLQDYLVEVWLGEGEQRYYRMGFINKVKCYTLFYQY